MIDIDRAGPVPRALACSVLQRDRTLSPACELISAPSRTASLAAAVLPRADREAFMSASAVMHMPACEQSCDREVVMSSAS